MAQPNCFKDLRAPVALHRGDAHLGHYFQHALFVGLDEVRLCVIRFGPVDPPSLGQVPDGSQCQVRVDGAGAVADQQCKVVDFSGVAGLRDQSGLGAGALSDQMMVDCCDRQQTRYGRPAAVCAAVGKYDYRAAGLYQLGSLFSNPVQRFLEAAFSGLPVIQRRYCAGTQSI